MATKFRPVHSPSTFRRVAAAMWRRPNNPSIYGSLDLDASAALAFLPEYGRRHDVKVTMSHLVARAVAVAIARHPEVNAKVRFWGKIEERESVDLVLQVATEGGRDLSTARLDRADEKSLADIAREIRRQAEKIRAGQDENLGKSRDLFQRLPWWLARHAVGLSDFLVNELHLDLASQGMPRDAFGSAMITNVGMFGIDTGFAPLVPIARCPMVVLVPEVRERPWVEAGAVVSRPVLRLCATFDHRIIDGVQAGQLSRELSQLMANPETLAGD
ncbi:MAG: 2-oxo acid dehydrogenase subunit E2 [Deltaproteobacteria bacterium]|nr:2-oxo acid dehydrogenase subunit E2 [Deltaproteobacteria bacterium]